MKTNFDRSKPDMSEEIEYNAIELTDEQVANVSGGSTGEAGRAFSCPKCLRVTNYDAKEYREYCEYCHYDASIPEVKPTEPELPQDFQLVRGEIPHHVSGKDLMDRIKNH
jgi:hypothetical protein